MNTEDTVRIYLDDRRPAPEGWYLKKTADDCIRSLQCGGVTELSLDHDLADDHYDRKLLDHVDENGYTDPYEYDQFKEKTGFSVVQWMIDNDVWPELIILHTMNPVGRDNMRRAIERHAPEHVRLEIRAGWRG